jgi:nudix-type nucleoside diphosphatase (YffH/AdpP family)
MSEGVNRPMKVEIHEVSEEEWKPFKLVTLRTSHERYEDAGMHEFSWRIFERGDSVGVLLYNTDSKEIVIVRQFRAPTLQYRYSGGTYIFGNDGQLDEIVAAMPRGNESPEDCAVREVGEEAGYLITHNALEKLAAFYVSPGGTSERLHLYYAEVTDANRVPGRSRDVAYIRQEAESILIRHVPGERFLADVVQSKAPVDSKLLVAALHPHVRNRILGRIFNEPATSEPLRFEFMKQRGCFVVLRPGDIENVKNVDAWINSENTDMEMDRFIAPTVSAKIRYLGAAKAKGSDGVERVIEDTVADALNKKRKGRLVAIGTVFSTEPGNLRYTHKVRHLFHVAAVNGIVNKGTYADEERIETAVRNALEAVEDRNRQWFRRPYKSVLLPMIGTGGEELPTEKAFPKILPAILKFFNGDRRTKLKEVHLSVFRERDVNIVKEKLCSHPDLEQRQ